MSKLSNPASIMRASRIILWGHMSVKRSAIPEALVDLSRWPNVDISALKDDQREAYQRRRDAVTMFVDQPDLPLSEIRRRTGVHPEQLYRLLNRCLKTHEDGRIFGLRGLLLSKHLKAYERVAQVASSTPRGKGGAAGALGRLLAAHPKLHAWLEHESSARGRPLRSGELREVRKTIRRLHKQFLDKCREVGVRMNEWPFNRDLLGYRSVQAFVYAHANRTASSESGKAGNALEAHNDSDLPPETDGPPRAVSPFDAVQFDGHKIDMRLTLRYIDPFGLESVFELTRLFILVCLDVVTRAVLGYHIAVSSEYDSDDVAKALQACFGDHKAPTFTIPGLRVRNEGGFPSERFESARYPGWRWFQYDNAKAHLAESTLYRLSEVTGCYIHAGRLGSPDDRAFIERFFAVLARTGLHQLPGTTGSSVDDVVKRLAELGPQLHLAMTLDELHQVVEVLLGDYNGQSHGGLGGRSPLEAMAYLLNKPEVQIRVLPAAKRRDLVFLQEAREVRVRGKESLHVNFGDERYTSDVLRDKPHLRGKKIRILFNIQDIRQLQAYAIDGSELGVLVASRAWNRTPHSLRQRQEIKRLVRMGKLRYRPDEDAIGAYAAYKRRQAPKNKKAATALAELVSTQKQTPAASPIPQPDEPGPSAPSEMSAPPMPLETLATQTGHNEATVEGLAETMPRPKPKALTIRRTLNF